jgi:GxxExxY protein
MNHQGLKARMESIPIDLDFLAKTAVDCAFAVHSALGPGLLESVYETCLAHELHKRGLQVERQVPLPVRYDGLELEAGFRLDLLVNRNLIIELKTVEVLLPVHHAQVLTYLKLSGLRLALLINFNSVTLKSGIKRIAL